MIFLKNSYVNIQLGRLGLQNTSIASLPRGKTLINECPGYDIKQSDGEASDLEISGMQSISSLPLLLGQLWPGVIDPDRVLCMGQIEQTE